MCMNQHRAPVVDRWPTRTLRGDNKSVRDICFVTLDQVHSVPASSTDAVQCTRHAGVLWDWIVLLHQFVNVGHAVGLRGPAVRVGPQYHR